MLDADYVRYGKEYRAVLEEAPDCIEAIVTCAELADWSGDPSSAMKAFLRVCVMPSKSDSDHEFRGEALQRTGKVNQAQDEFRLAANVRAQTVFEHAVRGFARLQVKEEALAEEDAKFVLDMGARPALGYCLLGSIHSSKGAYGEAIKNFSEAIRRNTTFVMAFNNRGYAHWLQRNDAAAIEDYDAALSILPHLREVLVNRANSYLRLKRFEDALSDYAAVVAMDPNAAGFVACANCNFGLRRDEQALDDLGRALDIEPKLAEAWIVRGVVYYRQKRYSEAINQFDEALKIQPGSARTLLLRSGAHRELGHKKEAVEDELSAGRLEAARSEAGEGEKK